MYVMELFTIDFAEKRSYYYCYSNKLKVMQDNIRPSGIKWYWAIFWIIVIVLAIYLTVM